MTIRRHTRRLSRRAAAQVLIAAYDQQARRKSTNSAMQPLAVSLDADVWEQVVSTLRPLSEGTGLELS